MPEACATLRRAFFAGIAQLVEQLICNQQVVGSNPSAGSNLKMKRSLVIVAVVRLDREFVRRGPISTASLLALSERFAQSVRRPAADGQYLALRFARRHL